NRRLIPVCITAECKNRLRERIGHEDLVAGSRISNVVHGSAELGFLSGQGSRRSIGALRQPGKSRNLRMSHSVRYQNLIAFAVVSDRAWITDLKSGRARRR